MKSLVQIVLLISILQPLIALSSCRYPSLAQSFLAEAFTHYLVSFAILFEPICNSPTLPLAVSRFPSICSEPLTTASEVRRSFQSII